ncbi:unnamed protein product [Didymodactylos carnosus]|uniref:AH domain-containing protein n=1 Tax=Didymodactylos carnosus TaxID=1234261 RepID=A0A814C7G5_9BILA|nr:unnamed protein product [Didymodactylos carnosus]CAF0937781.1 unnamed protein product [Didymodactylos carnosus]CAF3660811.1 unnamed protein product [Didymodactylos carnosus]CAF3714692.1 unnamed protein product [Didymodactylos carnosus]
MYSSGNSVPFDKFAEHQDKSTLGKLRQRYWKAKQIVIKKLGREEDECIIASDSDVDAKLELLFTVKRSCRDLLRIMERYQFNVTQLSHEETDCARFLKDYAQMDKTRAGKMMSSVSKVLAYTAQQRLALRQPLLRLTNEIETFENRAVTDTCTTVNKMERARTNYRGNLLWLKDASQQLDPDKQLGKCNKFFFYHVSSFFSCFLEKFRRVQSQVKQTKHHYDKLKGDVIQKIDLLTASRCNMYSHVLAPYQRTLLVFWEKTSKTMSAIAESFKGYQYYEFTVIKDLQEPNRLLSEMNSSNTIEEKKVEKKTKESDKNILQESSLIDIIADSEQQGQQLVTSPTTHTENDDVSPLIDILNESDAKFDDQLLELEKLTTLEPPAPKMPDQHNLPGSDSNDNINELIHIDNDKLFSEFLSSTEFNGNNATGGAGATDDFDSNWNAAFGSESTMQYPSSSAPFTTNAASLLNDDSSNFLPSHILNDLLLSNKLENSLQLGVHQQLLLNKSNANNKAPSEQPAKPLKQTTKHDKSNWFNLFADLDPLQNPDAVGGKGTVEAERSC